MERVPRLGVTSDSAVKYAPAMEETEETWA